MMDRRSGGQIKPYAGHVAAHDHVVGVREFAPVDRDCEAARRETQQRRTHAADKLVLRRACANHFAHRKGNQIAYAHRRC